MKIHASGEDYLEAVLILQKKQGMVRSIDLARHMGFSKPSMTSEKILQTNRKRQQTASRQRGIIELGKALSV